MALVARVVERKPVAAQRCDRWLSAPMFWLAVAFLVLASGVIHRIGEGFESRFEFALISWSLILSWPVFIAEALLRLFFCIRAESVWWRLFYTIAICAAPPLRMACRSYADPTRLWLPGRGWCVVDRHLRRRLEHFFSVPMMAIALLILPVLAMEYFWVEWVRAHFAASLFLDIASSIIWMAFAAEFILMCSVADKKWRYALQNWMDLAIVVLPLIDFLPLLRLLRLTRLLAVQQLTSLGRLYRLRGLLLKLWRAILLLEVLNRLVGNRKEKRLQRLKELLAAKLDEIADLKQEIAQLEREVAAKADNESPADKKRAITVIVAAEEEPFALAAATQDVEGAGKSNAPA
jgi:hypothetical protein